MSHFIGTMLGLGVEEKDEALAEQLLKCIGADPDGEDMYEEIGRLDGGYDPDISGPLDDYDPLGISSSVQEKFSEYMNRFDDYFPIYGEGDDEDDERDVVQKEADENSRLDDLCLLVKQIFGEARVYLAHEEGNSGNDSYYRYEAILDPSTGKKSVVNCYYSYDGGPDKEEGTEWSEQPINAHKYDANAIDDLIKKAESLHFDELAEKLKAYKNDPETLDMDNDETAHAPDKQTDSSVADTWDCECGEKGIAGAFCSNCGGKRPMPVQMGTWNCACGMKGISANFCPNCGSKRKRF